MFHLFSYLDDKRPWNRGGIRFLVCAFSRPSLLPWLLPTDWCWNLAFLHPINKPCNRMVYSTLNNCSTNLASVGSLPVIFFMFSSTRLSVSRAFSSSAWKFSTATAMIFFSILSVSDGGAYLVVDSENLCGKYKPLSVFIFWTKRHVEIVNFFNEKSRLKIRNCILCSQRNETTVVRRRRPVNCTIKLHMGK